MDKVIKVIDGVGEIGIDTEASPGNGQYYVKLYDGSYDACGFETEQEALAELEYALDCDDDDGYALDCDDSDDGYALASAGFGTDEDYGYYGEDY